MALRRYPIMDSNKSEYEELFASEGSSNSAATVGEGNTRAENQQPFGKLNTMRANN